jgi:hypothetical protein
MSRWPRGFAAPRSNRVYKRDAGSFPRGSDGPTENRAADELEDVAFPLTHGRK